MKRTLALILTVLMLVSLIPASLINVIARGPGVLPNGLNNQQYQQAPGQYIPETVLIDGILNDTAWPNEDWKEVNSDSGTWSKQYPLESNYSKTFKYQLKVDYYYLYGAVVIEKDAAPTGNVTLWLNDGSMNGGYTDKFVIDFSAGDIKRYDKDGNELQSYLAQYGVQYDYETFEFKFNDEKTIVEFRSHRADFSNSQNANFSYFMSAEFDGGESLYHPAIAVNEITGDEREALFPSADFWPEGAQVITEADVNGYGAHSLSKHTYIDLDGRLDEAIWASQTEFYLKWYDRLALPSWTDNLQGGSVGSNVDSDGKNYKDFADISANYLPYKNNTAAKFDLYVSGNYIYGAALVHDDYDGATEHTGVRFYMYQNVDGVKRAVQVDLRYDADSTGNDYGKFGIGDGTNGLTWKKPQDLGIYEGSVDLTYDEETATEVGDIYFDNQYHGVYEYDATYGRYYESASEEPHGYTNGYATLGFTYSQRPAGPNLYVYEFMIDRNAWGKVWGNEDSDDFSTFVPEEYSFASFAELGATFVEDATYKNASGTYFVPRYFKNPNGEFYEPYTQFTPDATLSERFWPGMVSSADSAVNSNTYGDTTRVDVATDNLYYYPSIRGDLNYLYGSVVVQASKNFGEWKPGTAASPEGGDWFGLWFAEHENYTGGTFDGTLHQYGVWMDETGKAHVGSYYSGTWVAGGDAWEVAIKKYDDSKILKPSYANAEIDGKVTGDYTSTYITETNDYYVIEFRIPMDSLGYPGITLDINNEKIGNEVVQSATNNPIGYYYTSMHLAPSDADTAAGDTDGFTMFYPRSDTSVTSHTLTSVSDAAVTYAFPQIFNEHDIFVAITADGKIIEEQRVPLETQVINFANSEYRVPSQDGNYLSYNAMMLAGAEYTMFGASIDGVIKHGGYSDSGKTKVTIWFKDTGLNGGTIYKYEFFNNGKYNYMYVNGSAYSGLGAYAFSSANNETYFEAGLLTENFDKEKDGFEFFFEVTQVINGEELSRVVPKIKLPEIKGYENYFALFDGDNSASAGSGVWSDNAGYIERIEHFAPDAIAIDGNFNDNAWKDEWTFVSRDINACGQETNPVADLAQTDFYYQMRMDEDYLYVAAVIEYYDSEGNAVDASTISSTQNPGFRLWIKSGEYGDSLAAGNSKTYTNYYDVKLSGLSSQENTFPTFANNTRPFYSKYYQYVNPDSNKDGYVNYDDFTTGTNTINVVVDANNKFSTYRTWGYGDSTLWGETEVTHLDAESTIVNSATGQTRGEMVDTGAIIKKIEELKKTGGDDAVAAFISELANRDENPCNIEVSTGIEKAVMEAGAGKQPNGFSTTLGTNTMVVEFKVELDEFDGNDKFEYYVSTATHNSWTSKTTMYPAIVSDPGSKSNYYHVNYPYWKWTDEHSVVVDEELRAELMMRTYKKPVITLGAKVSNTYSYYDGETLHDNVNAIRFGGVWNEEYIRKVNGLRETDGYTLTGQTDNIAYEGDTSVGNYTDYWDVKQMGMVIMPTHLVKYNEREDAAHPGNYDLFVDTTNAAWMDADGIVKWAGTTSGNSKNNFADYENFAFYVTVVNAPANMNFCFRGFVTYYNDVSGATPYYDAILERNMNMVVDSATNSPNGDQTYEDEALFDGPFTDEHYKPGTGTDGSDKENENQGGTTEPQNVVINSIELVTDGSTAPGSALFTPTIKSINGNASLVSSAVADSGLLVQWWNEDASAMFADDYVLVAGVKHDLYVRLPINSGYEFSNNCTMTLVTADGTLIGEYYAPYSGETGRAYDFWITPEVEIIPDVTYDFDVVNPSEFVAGRTVLYANSNYSAFSEGLHWWTKALLEYDDNEDNYKVIAVDGLNSSAYLDWDFGIDRIIIAAHADDEGNNLVDRGFIGSLQVGQRLQINGATLETLKATSDSSISGLSIQVLDVEEEVITKPGVEDLTLTPLVPNATNGEKVAYVPLDNRPVHTDRVIYQAASAGISLLMPEANDYTTNLSTDESVASGGNPEAILEWLKKQEKAGVDYYVIALDQVFSGGLVTSREASTCTTADGGLSEHDKDAIAFLTQLAKENYVVYTDTIIRLAMTTSGYVGYGSDDDRYHALRNFGIAEREKLGATGNHALTLDNVISSYRYDGTGVGAISYTTNGDYTVSESELDGLLNARERKIRIIDALIKNAGGNIDRLIVGLDDANATNHNLQSNERAYVEQIATQCGANLYTIAGCDEMGMMGIAALTADCYLDDADNNKIPVNVVYYGASGAELWSADQYDAGSLKEAIDEHLAALGAYQVAAGQEHADGVIQVLVLTRGQQALEESTNANLTALEGYAANLAAQIKANLDDNVPTVVLDCSNHYGGCNTVLITAMRNVSGGDIFSRNDFTELLAYSKWNTIGNTIGLGLGSGFARYNYLVSADEITDEANMAFIKYITYAYIKDIVYKRYAAENDGTQWNLEESTQTALFYSAEWFRKRIANDVSSFGHASMIMLGKYDGSEFEQKGFNYNIVLSDFYNTWGREFEATWTITVTQK